MKLPKINPMAEIYAQLIKVILFLVFSCYIFWNYVVTRNAFDGSDFATIVDGGILAIYVGSMIIHFTLMLMTYLKAISRMSRRL
ncbi:hypothetical protein EAH77_16000 [Ewingella americana]|uniref:Uncharacterized protein n=1 Tax=Ewingella americana TaxID=41202 RepID=A0A502GD92_9GAMM|nr:hypothetical protein EAH77_16000 [Ewingella americana]